MRWLLTFLLLLPEIAASHELAYFPLLHEDSSQSFVLLPDGSRYNLDSEFWRAAAAIANDAETSPVEINPLKKSLVSKISQFADKKFWVDMRDRAFELGISGAESFQRYGPFTMSLIALAEVLEHTLLPPGTPPFCVLIQSGCVLTSRQLQEIWSATQYRFPGNQPLDKRLLMPAKVLAARYRFWRSMRLVFDADGAVIKHKFKKQRVMQNAVSKLLLDSPFWSAMARRLPSCDGSDLICSRGLSVTVDKNSFLKPIEGESPVLVRYFSAQEQLAFMDLSLQLTKAQISKVRMSWLRAVRLRLLLARMGRTVDRYALVLSRMALHAGGDLEEDRNREFIENFVTGFFQFEFLFADYTAHLDRWVLPERARAAQMFAFPKKMLREIRQFEKSGRAPPCPSLLFSS